MCSRTYKLVTSTSSVKSPKQANQSYVSHQAAAKRYKVTGTGKVILRHPGKQHINEKKSSKRLSNLGKAHLVSIHLIYCALLSCRDSDNIHMHNCTISTCIGMYGVNLNANSMPGTAACDVRGFEDMCMCHAMLLAYCVHQNQSASL